MYQKCHTTTIARKCNETGLNYQKSHRVLFAATSYLNSYTARFASNQTPSAPVSIGSNVGETTAADSSVAANAPGYALEAPDLTIPVDQLTALGEPTLASLGLASWYPTGWIQQMLEWIHVYGDLSWFTTFIVYAFILRTCLVPLQIYYRKIAIVQRNVMPELTKLRQAITEAKARGDNITTNLRTIQLLEYKKINEAYSKKLLISAMSVVPPILIANIMALRSMANLPVESLKSGGLYWITDLTIPDPLFILPVMVLLTSLATLEIGNKRPSTQTTINIKEKWALRGLSGVIAIILAYQPALLGMCWLTFQTSSIIMTRVYKIPRIEKKLNMPKKESD